jgi:hypothetical protein
VYIFGSVASLTPFSSVETLIPSFVVDATAGIVG